MDEGAAWVIYRGWGGSYLRGGGVLSIPRWMRVLPGSYIEGGGVIFMGGFDT